MNNPLKNKINDFAILPIKYRGINIPNGTKTPIFPTRLMNHMFEL
jgi:hypothetical protein